jgi:hypothetical protein
MSQYIQIYRFPSRAPCPAHPTPLHFVTSTILAEQHKLWSSMLYKSLHISARSCLLSPQHLTVCERLVMNGDETQNDIVNTSTRMYVFDPDIQIFNFDPNSVLQLFTLNFTVFNATFCTSVLH